MVAGIKMQSHTIRSSQLLPLLFLSILAPSTATLQRISGSDREDCPSECLCSERNTKLESVTCSSLNLSSIPDGIPPTTKKLDLSKNNLTRIGPTSLAHLKDLRELNVKSNLIKEVDTVAFVNLSQLKELTLSRNQLNRFPSEVIQPQSPIELLNLEYNEIIRLESGSVPGSSKLFTLLLGHNRMESIADDAFGILPRLQILELNDNRLSEVPTALSRLPHLQELSLANNRIKQLTSPLNEIFPKIVYLEVRGNPLKWIHPEAFAHLQHLKKLILSDVRNLTEIPDLNGTTSLEILRIDRCSLQAVPADLCSSSPHLKSLDLKSNRIRQLPDFAVGCLNLRNLDLSSNLIDTLDDGAFINLSNLHHLHLSRNRVIKLTSETFVGLSQLRALDLSYNNIDDIHPTAFLPVEKLEDLNLGNNLFSQLPSAGLSGVIHLKTFNNPNLREFPGPESFKRVRTLVLSYAYHCCQFSPSAMALLSNFQGKTESESTLQEDVIYPTDTGFDSALSTLNLSELWPGIENFSNHGSLSQDFIKTFAAESMRSDDAGDLDFMDPGMELFVPPLARHHRYEIQCIPQPGPFLPCNDLFDWWTLRCGVWIVFLLALMGNGTVVFVLIFARTKMDVPRFLVCNLAIADFFMGVYLGFLAVVDSATLGEFRRYAIPWQLSSGCQMAGFLGVLSSELSVYTLAVITMERHYAITHAMHLNKRLSLRHAAYIMALGWAFSLVMAILPLVGVSDYRKFAVCLPFEIGDAWSLSYVVFLMFANGVAFTILMGCYLKMYCSIRGSQAWNSNDTRIAKRMALLVFTDLLCWFPIAFFSLTAVFGLQLVSLEEAKVFTVFILPFNSCCNPFLYAILTKQFKKDCVLICKAIEESRVTRGIGRCRNSSNFSNRQTAPNTGSLVEKSSKDGQPCICHSGLHPGRGDVNGNAKYRFIPAPERWSRYGPVGRFISRYILRQNNSKEANRQARDDYRMRNVRRYLYNTSNAANFQQEGEKHQRHASVSSDNFSSSRSDSWRAQGRCGIPLRLLEPRRRNSWAVTRKPSQDSNLSNSRNDSSGTSNSTATWQMSRSSVSSDAASHSGGGKSSLKRSIPGTTASVPHLPLNPLPHPTAINSIQTSANVNSGSAGSKRPKTLQFVEEHASINANPITGIPRRSSQPTDAIHVLSESAKPHNANPKPFSRKKQDPTVVLIDDDEVSAKIATNRPRLIRQSAFFSDEVVIEPEICPVHGSLIPGTYDDDDNDDGDGVSDLDEIGEEDEDEDLNGDPTSPILRKQSGSSPVIAPGGTNFNSNPYGVALVIVPRRLSTISSRDTTSLQSRDDSGTEFGSSSGNLRSPNRRKMSEQPLHLYVLPPTSAKWHSMSSVEIQQHEAQPQSNSPRNSNAHVHGPLEGAASATTSTQILDNDARKVSFQLPNVEENLESPDEVNDPTS